MLLPAGSGWAISARAGGGAGAVRTDVGLVLALVAGWGRFRGMDSNVYSIQPLLIFALSPLPVP